MLILQTTNTHADFIALCRALDDFLDDISASSMNSITQKLPPLLAKVEYGTAVSSAYFATPR